MKGKFLWGIILLAVVIAAMTWFFAGRTPRRATLQNAPPQAVLSQGIVLPAAARTLERQMVEAGVISRAILDGSSTEPIAIDAHNADVILNFLWALGLANKNPILETGPMRDLRYGGTDWFASTAGWTLGRGNAMDYYAKLDLVSLTASQQLLVEEVAKKIYRPCCDNPAYFPDCNHGMAMLGLLELMASQAATADQMYRAALTVNSYWFPDAYRTIMQYLQGKGIAWDSINPKELLAADFSSAQGYGQIVAQLQPAQSNSSNACGV